MWKPLRMTWENKQNFRALLETIRKTGFEGEGRANDTQESSEKQNKTKWDFKPQE